MTNEKEQRTISLKEAVNLNKPLDTKTTNGATCWESIKNGVHLLNFSQYPYKEVESIVVSGSDFDIGSCMLYGGGNTDFHKSNNIYFSIFVGRKNALIRVNWNAPKSMDQVMLVYQDTESTGLSSPVISPDGRWIAFLAAHGDDYSLKVVDIHGDYPAATICNDFDFYAQPVWHPSSKELLWIAWNNPHMPWSQTAIIGASLAFNHPHKPVTVKNKKTFYEKPSVALQQPSFSIDGEWLAFISDESGFSRIYVVKYDGISTNYLHFSQILIANNNNAEPPSCDTISKIALPTSNNNPGISNEPSEFCTPLWVEGLRHYQWAPGLQEDHYYIIATETRSASQFINHYTLEKESDKQLRVRFTEALLEQSELTSIKQLSVDPTLVEPGKIGISFIGSSPDLISTRCLNITYPLSETKINKDSGETETGPDILPLTLPSSSDEEDKKLKLVTPTHRSWTTDDGVTLHAIFYDLYYTPPKPLKDLENPALVDEIPNWDNRAAIIFLHGGPTGQALIEWDFKYQHYAMYNYVVCNLNYRGSTGYGRAYADAMNGAWGKTDVEDVVSTYHYLVSRGINRDQIFLFGASSAGATILNTLGRHPGLFAGAIVSYPVVNYEGYNETTTHKFERYYNEQLVGSFDNEREKYTELSPMAVIDKICDPLLLFHGTDDKVVDVTQSRNLVKILRENYVNVEYHEYQGEGHGFKKTRTQLDCYMKIFCFIYAKKPATEHNWINERYEKYKASDEYKEDMANAKEALAKIRESDEYKNCEEYDYYDYYDYYNEDDEDDEDEYDEDDDL